MIAWSLTSCSAFGVWMLGLGRHEGELNLKPSRLCVLASVLCGGLAAGGNAAAGMMVLYTFAGLFGDWIGLEI